MSNSDIKPNDSTLKISSAIINLERQQLSFEDAYGQSLREFDLMKNQLQAQLNEVKLRELEVADRLRELQYMKNHQREVTENLRRQETIIKA
jgi:hypothetical protein